MLFENNWYDYKMFVNNGIKCKIVPYRLNLVLNEPGYKTVKWKIHRFLDELLKNKLVAYRVKNIGKRNNRYSTYQYWSNNYWYKYCKNAKSQTCMAFAGISR